VQLKRSWILIIGITLVALSGSVLATLSYINRAAKPLPPPKDEATRRAAQQERIVEDFKQIANYYKAYCSETKMPTSGGFWAYIDGQKDARTISGYIKEQQYAICVPLGGTGIIGFEKDRDLNNTRVVVMADGSVNKAMPEQEFQAICPDQFLDRTAKP
jgi:hypothetical protein